MATNLVHFEPLRSEHVARVSYDQGTSNLHVTFHNKARKNAQPKTYTFANVPPSVFSAMTKHPSTGAYFHKVIKKYYRQTNGNSKDQS